MLFNEFPDKGCKLGNIDYLLKKIRKTCTVNSDLRTGRPHVVLTGENIETVDDFWSQEDKLKTHRTTRHISRETGIHCSNVHRIIHCDLHLECLKRRRPQQLSEANRVARLTRC